MPIDPPLPHDAERLVISAVASLSAAHLRKRKPRAAFWGTLRGVFLVGSTSACAIARSCGYDPDSGEPVAASRGDA